MKKVINVLFLIGIICLLFDIIVSYAVFINATDYFIEHELNKYMLSEFQRYNLLTILLRDFLFPVIIINLLLSLWFKIINFGFFKQIAIINKRLIAIMQVFLIIFLLLLSILHIVGVLSWLF